MQIKLVIKNAQIYAKNIKKVQKWRIFATFLNLTFELFVGIAKQKKTCPNGQVLKLWLRSVCSSRAELFKIGREIDVVKDKLWLVDLK